MIRLFAACEVPGDIAEGLQRRQEGLKGARWRPQDALHLTLRFFGELDGATAHDLDEALAEVTAAPFDLHLQGVGAFGDNDHMRAVWAGVAENPALRVLQGRVESAARRVGIKAEPRHYRPHVTLAYLNAKAEAPRVAAWVQAHNLLRSPPWRVMSFHLYSSWSGPDGSSYEIERSYGLPDNEIGPDA